MANPLIAAEKEVYDISPKDDDFVDLVKRFEEVDSKIEAIWKAASISNDPTGQRLARLCLRAAKAHEESFDPEAARYTMDETMSAAQFTEDPFEARLVGLALSGWWNDVISAAFRALDIDESKVDGKEEYNRIVEAFPAEERLTPWGVD